MFKLFPPDTTTQTGRIAVAATTLFGATIPYIDTLSGLVGRYAANDVAGIDASPVVAWPGRIGPTLEQATASARPLIIDNAANEKRAVQFDGVNDVLTAASSITVGTVIMVSKIMQALPFQDYDGCITGTGTGEDAVWFIGSSGSSEWYASGKTRYKDGSQTNSVDGNWHVYIATADTPVANTTPIIGIDRIYAERQANFQVAEIAFFNRKLTAEEIATVTLQLKGDYGIV